MGGVAIPFPPGPATLPISDSVRWRRVHSGNAAGRGRRAARERLPSVISSTALGGRHDPRNAVRSSCFVDFASDRILGGTVALLFHPWRSTGEFFPR